MRRTPAITLALLMGLCTLSLFFPGLSLGSADTQLRGTGDLGIVIERAAGSVLVVEHSTDTVLHRIEGLGDLSPCLRRVLEGCPLRLCVRPRRGPYQDRPAHRAHRQAHRPGGNAIGGAISQDGSLVAVSNYEPGGVKVFSTEDLSLVADIPARAGAGDTASKTVGLVDAPGQRFVYSLFDANQIWVVDMSDPDKPDITRFNNVGSMPYDGLISSDGRTYMAGLFGEDGLAMLDLWQPQRGVRRVLPDYGRGEEKLPVYKMPHLEGWAMTDKHAFLPAVGHHQVLVVNREDWSERARIEVKGQPVFVMARPDGRQVWVNFAFPDNQWIQVIDVPTMKVIQTLDVGKGALHMEFTPRGEKVWISVRDENAVKVFDTADASLLKTLPVARPSGIFFTNRAGRTGL